jgi:antibiotic biosynthesis monooxygenase (ABM) superfamily enzyme
MIVSAIILTIQIISYTQDFLLFKSHFEIKIQNPIYDSIRLPSFRLCFKGRQVSKFRINKERMKYNISRDFDLYSLLLDRRKFNSKEFIKCGVKVEFYEFTEGWNKNCTEFEEYIETEIHIKFGSKSNEFFYCFRYDTKNLRIQTLLSKSSPFLKISLPENFYKLLELKWRMELIGFQKEGNVWFTTKNGDLVLTSVMKSSITYLQNPYKSQCSYYDTINSYLNCSLKCLETNSFIKYKCVNRDYEYVIRRLDEFSFDSKVECNENELITFNVREKCKKICPIDCLREEYFFTNEYFNIHENNDQNTYYFLWDSREAFFSYEETADMLFIDYLTYIGGLIGLWFGICIETLLDLLVKHTRNLRTKVKLQVEKLLSFVYVSSFSILHFINDLIRNFMNYMIERVSSIQNRISQFRTCFSHWLKFLIDLIITYARICRFKLKLYAKTFFYFTVNSIQLLIVLFLSFIFCSKSMFEIQVMKLLLLIYIFFNYILKSFNNLFVIFINCFENNMFRTHNRVESINL